MVHHVIESHTRDFTRSRNFLSSPFYGIPHAASRKVGAMHGKETLGQRIVRLREERGWSGSDLAREAKISRGTLGDIEKGHRAEPGATIFVKIALALGVAGRYLLNGTGHRDLIDPNEVEAEAVDIAKHLTEGNRNAWLAAGHAMLESQKPKPGPKHLARHAPPR